MIPSKRIKQMMKAREKQSIIHEAKHPFTMGICELCYPEYFKNNKEIWNYSTFRFKYNNPPSGTSK